MPGPTPTAPGPGAPTPEAPATPPPAQADASPPAADPNKTTSPGAPGSKPETSAKPEVEKPTPRPTSEIQSLSEPERRRLMASAAAATNCGDGTGCGVIDQFAAANRTLNVNFKLDGWQASFLSARDAILDVEGYVFHRPDREDVIIAFRGSESDLSQGAFNDWVNVNARANAKHYGGRKIAGAVHEGFLEAMYGVWHPNETGLIKVLNDAKLKGKSFWITGHSQGAALATLIAMRLDEDNLQIAGVYAFGMPRLATFEFQAAYNRVLGPKTQVFANRQDPVPHLPPQFTSVGQNAIFWPPSTQTLGKDGVPAWDFVTAGLSGNAAHHSLTDRVNGYFGGL